MSKRSKESDSSGEESDNELESITKKIHRRKIKSNEIEEKSFSVDDMEEALEHSKRSPSGSSLSFNSMRDSASRASSDMSELGRSLSSAFRPINGSIEEEEKSKSPSPSVAATESQSPYKEKERSGNNNSPASH